MSAPAQASALGGILGLLVALFAAFAFVILWPIRRFFKRRRAASAQPAEQRDGRSGVALINFAARAQSLSSGGVAGFRPARAGARVIGPAHQIVIRDGTGQVVDRVSSRALGADHPQAGVVEPAARRPADYLPDNSRLERLDLELPPAMYSVGPDWLKVWYVPFFGVLLLASLAIKVAARIE